LADVPARLEKLAIVRVESTAPAMMTLALFAAAEAARPSALSPVGSVPLLPADITTTIPAAAARAIAALTSELGSGPPSEMLITRTPATRAASIPRAIAPSELSHLSLVQFVGSEEFSETMVAPKATPRMPDPLRAAAAVAAVAVPWPSWSVTPRLPPATSPLAGSILPAKSGRLGFTPVSTRPILIPWPVAPAL